MEWRMFDIEQWFGGARREKARLRLLRDKRKQAAEKYEVALEDGRRLEAELRQKRREYDGCTSKTQRSILVAQITALADELEQLIERKQITNRYVEDIAAAIHRSEMIIAADEQNLGGAMIDRIAVELEEAIEKMKDSDVAMMDLRRQQYSRVAVHRRAASSLAEAVEEKSEPELGADTDPLPRRTRERLRTLGIEAD
jgi:hypothetical protein